MMIECLFYEQGGVLTGFTVRGHDKVGKNGISLLCCAVSSAVYLTVNALTEIAGLTPLTLRESSGNLTAEFSREDAKEHSELIGGLRLHCLSLQKSYPRRIKTQTVLRP